MIAIEIAWLSLLILLASWFGNLAVINRILRFLFLFKRGPSVAEVCQLVTMALFLLVHVAGAIVLAVYVSLGVAIIAISGASLVWGLFSYFLLQRFAGPLQRPGIVMASPLFLPLSCFASFASTALAFFLYTRWYLALVPFLVWFVLGYISAEMAIRGNMKLSKDAGGECDRRIALSIINHAQGRLLLRPDRYPFP